MIEYRKEKNINPVSVKVRSEDTLKNKLAEADIEELKIERISLDELNVFKDEDLKTAYLYYLMNNGYTYEEKVIRNGATDEEFAYISENNDKLKGFNTRVDWERVYPYGDTFRPILGTASRSSQGIPQGFQPPCFRFRCRLPRLCRSSLL